MTAFYSTFSHVTLVSDNGKYYRAHKIVLISCSSVLGNMFESHKDKDQEIFIYFPEVPHQYLKAMLDFMYLGQVAVAQENIEDFMQIMRNLEMKGISGSFGPESEDSLENEEDEIVRRNNCKTSSKYLNVDQQNIVEKMTIGNDVSIEDVEICEKEKDEKRLPPCFDSESEDSLQDYQINIKDVIVSIKNIQASKDDVENPNNIHNVSTEIVKKDHVVEEVKGFSLPFNSVTEEAVEGEQLNMKNYVVRGNFHQSTENIREEQQNIKMVGNHLSNENIDKSINMVIDEKKEESPVNATDIGRFIGKDKKGRKLFQ